MCGICGKVMKDPSKPVEKGLIKRMCEKLEHRGPDDSKIYTGEGVGLGHRRLSIIDLTPEAAQPLSNEDNTLFLVANGEIYNYMELREELMSKGHRFKTVSDSEVILHLYEEYGTKCFEHMEGMFSFALWNVSARELVAGRDRMGQKPFFYYENEGDITFASEIASLIEDSTVPREVNPRGVFDFFSYFYVPAPQTAFNHLHRLLPGHFLVWREGRIRIERYWKLSFEKQEFIGSEKEVMRSVRERIRNSVSLRLRSDVDVGIFLSGGIDSGVIAAEASTEQNDIRAFSVSFNDEEYDESEYAAMTARALGIDHTVIRAEQDVSALLPHLALRYGDLFADSSCIPTYYISKAASEHVKVILSGDGGDELFGGYYRYRAFAYQTLLRIVPSFIKKPFFRLGSLVGRHAPRNSFREHAGRFFRTLLAKGYGYSAWVFLLNQEEKIRMMKPGFLETVPDRELPSEIYLTHLMVKSGCWNFSEKAMAADTATYLPGDLLQKMDTASMANSLEVRSPFLDTSLVEYVSSLPVQYKINKRRHKYILRKAYAHKLPGPVIKRKKMGFAVPLASYIRNDLSSLILELFSGEDAFIREVFRDEVIDGIVGDLRDDRVENPAFVFALLMCELWHSTFLGAG